MPHTPAVKRQKNKWVFAKNLLFAISFFAVAAINDSPYLKKSDPEYRTPTNIKSGKLSSMLKKPFVSHTSKLSAPMITQIKSDHQEIGDGDTFRLVGSFTANQSMNNVNIKWILPPEIEIINGKKKSKLTSVKAGKEYSFELNLKSTTDDNQMIHLIAESHMGNSSFSNSSQFQTQLQKAFDESHRRLHQRAKDYAAETNK